jgi:hypothetical protein
MDAKLFFGNTATGTCLVMFQVTVAGKHPPDSAIWGRIFNRVCVLRGITSAKDKKAFKVALVFLTDSNGIRTKQTITTTSTGEEANFSFEVHQFAMLLGNEFDEILKWENERNVTL